MTLRKLNTYEYLVLPPISARTLDDDTVIGEWVETVPGFAPEMIDPYEARSVVIRIEALDEEVAQRVFEALKKYGI